MAQYTAFAGHHFVVSSEYPVSPYPAFEGAVVSAAKLKISAGAALELDDLVVHVDDLVQVLVTVKVTGVHHDVHRSSGHLMRVQLSQVQNCELWTPGG